MAARKAAIGFICSPVIYRRAVSLMCKCVYVETWRRHVFTPALREQATWEKLDAIVR